MKQQMKKLKYIIFVTTFNKPKYCHYGNPTHRYVVIKLVIKQPVLNCSIYHDAAKKQHI